MVDDVSRSVGVMAWWREVNSATKCTARVDSKLVIGNALTCDLSRQLLRFFVIGDHSVQHEANEKNAARLRLMMVTNALLILDGKLRLAATVRLKVKRRLQLMPQLIYMRSIASGEPYSRGS